MRWFWQKRDKGIIIPSSAMRKKVLLLVDFDNMLICLHQKFGSNMQLDHRIQKLLEWVKSDVGEVLCGIVFAPEHLNMVHRRIWAEYGLEFMTCPKQHLTTPKRNTKTGKMQTIFDTVDETLIRFAKMMSEHPKVGYICLVSGDGDYAPIMHEVTKYGIRRALAVPTIGSLSPDLAKLIDVNPNTGRKMVFRLDTVE